MPKHAAFLYQTSTSRKKKPKQKKPNSNRAYTPSISDFRSLRGTITSDKEKKKLP